MDRLAYLVSVGSCTAMSGVSCHECLSTVSRNLVPWSARALEPPTVPCSSSQAGSNAVPGGDKRHSRAPPDRSTAPRAGNHLGRGFRQSSTFWKDVAGLSRTQDGTKKATGHAALSDRVWSGESGEQAQTAADRPIVHQPSPRLTANVHAHPLASTSAPLRSDTLTLHKLARDDEGQSN